MNRFALIRPLRALAKPCSVILNEVKDLARSSARLLRRSYYVYIMSSTSEVAHMAEITGRSL